MKDLTTRLPNYMQIYFPYSTVNLLPLQYSNFCLSSEWTSLYSDLFYF